MCDYSLHHVVSRPAKVGDKLVVTEFGRSPVVFPLLVSRKSRSACGRARSSLLTATCNTTGHSAFLGKRA
jgi:hypothetical protein